MGTIAQLLMERAGDDSPAILFEDERHSWADTVSGGATRAAYTLDRRDPARPLHIGVMLENVPEFLHWIAAAAFARATLVAVNPTRRGAELGMDVRHTDCQMLVTDRAGAEQLAGLDTGVSSDRIVVVDDPASTETLGPYTTERPPDTGAHEDDQILLLFTSGSTGRPKAVICTQGRFATTAERTPRMFEVERDTTTYLSMPLFHGNSLFANWAPVLKMGATVALRRRFSASGFLPDVRRFGATYFNYVGRALAYVLATPEGPDDADNPLRLGFGTEASGPDRIRFEQRFGCRIIESYGSSEGAISIARTRDSPPHALGLPPPGVEVAVLDPASGDECLPARFDAAGALVNGTEAIGEIVGLNTASAFEGYYANPDANAERVHDGRFWSGDLGYRDEAGFFYFAGRGGDWLRVDSENFAAAPVERILHRWPPVVMCAVYPVPDPRTGDQVMAAMELEPGASFDPGTFEAFLAEQGDLGTKWAPRFVRVVASMPLTASSKMQKAPLRAEGWETSDPMWWQPRRGEPYRALTEDDRLALRRDFEAHGRLHLVSAR